MIANDLSGWMVELAVRMKETADAGGNAMDVFPLYTKLALSQASRSESILTGISESPNLES